VNAVKPLSEVENPEFRRLIEEVAEAPADIIVPSRRIITDRLEKRFVLAKDALKQKLQKVTHVCTTADGWSCRRRHYMGVTVHWLDPDTLARKSACLGIKRVKHKHTHDVIASTLSRLHAEFGLRVEKIVRTITDNGSNFVKAFDVFGPQAENGSDLRRGPQQQKSNNGNSSSHLQDFDGFSSDDSDVSSDDEDDETTAEFSPFDVFEQLEKACDESLAYTDSDADLPNHARCAAHILNLVAKKDVPDALVSNSEWSYTFVRNHPLAKC
jgi:hypothetical protein